MEFGDRSDNPFSVSLSLEPRPRWQALKSAFRFFLVVCLCLAATLVITNQARKWLVHRLMRDFNTLNSHEREERLIQLAEFGPDAVPSLVEAMSDPDMGVGRTAYELLQQAQNNWSVLEESERNARHGVLVDSLAASALRLPDDRTGWGTMLLQQTLLETVDRDSDQARQLYRDANHAIDLLSLSSRSPDADPDRSTRIATSASNDGMGPRRLEVRAQPLPVDRTQAAELWTQWPPPSDARGARDQESMAERALSDQMDSSQAESAGDSVAGDDAPSVYRSGGSLQSLEASEDVLLSSAPQPQETSFQISEIQPTVHLVDSPLETYDDLSVIRWLGSEHSALRSKATSELRRRGYGDEELSMASQLAVADTSARLELVDVIARSNRLDPRAWLLMLLQDPSRDVRLRAISVLATMNDPLVSQRLQLHLVDERDPTVAARIRRVLKLR